MRLQSPGGKRSLFHPPLPHPHPLHFKRNSEIDMFWSRSTPTVQDIAKHIDEIRVRATKLDKTLQLGQSMSYLYVLLIMTPTSS